MREILSAKTITRALRNDPVFRKSFGIGHAFPMTRTFAVIWGVWMLLLVVSPLPEQILLHRLSILAAALFAAAFLFLDTLKYGTRIADVAQRLFYLLEADPRCKTVASGRAGVLTLQHAKFSAECQPDTALLLSEMVDLEQETVSTLQRIKNR